MSIKRVTIESDYPLEGILRSGSKHLGTVICHPHPLYGGSMVNNVVDAIEEGFSSIGYTTLRFNFRGVGRSLGTYDEGEGEVTDLIASTAFLKGRLAEDATIILSGYSFGAWVCSRAYRRIEGVDGLFLVAYPFSIYSVDELKGFKGKVFFIGGRYDDISPMDQLLKTYQELPQVEKSIKIIPTDHLFYVREGEIKDFIIEALGACAQRKG
jgi:hypothetical protein